MADAATEVCSAGEVASESDADAEVVSEVDDVVQGNEPGASRFSMLVPTDSYDDMAKFADTDDVPRSTIEQLRVAADCELADSSSERAIADADDSCAQNERLKPPQPIFARIDTPSSLSDEDVDRQRLSAAPAFDSQAADDAARVTVEILGTIQQSMQPASCAVHTIDLYPLN